MKLFDKLNELNVFGSIKDFEGVMLFLYQHRIYITDALDEDLPLEVKEFIESFLENDKEYNGDESAAWERLLLSEYKGWRE